MSASDLDPSKDQDHTHFVNEYLWNCNGSKLLLPSNSKYSCIGFRFSYFHLTLTNSKVQCQGDSHFDDEYFGNGDISSKNYYYHNYKVTYVLLIGSSTFDLCHSKGQCQGNAYFDNEYLENSIIYGTNHHCHQMEIEQWAFDCHI